MWKTGATKASDTRKITMIPIIFITKPALSKSLVRILPVAYIIALGGVATETSSVKSYLKDKTYQLVT
jgi:hypothetical protein